MKKRIALIFAALLCAVSLALADGGSTTVNSRRFGTLDLAANAWWSMQSGYRDVEGLGGSTAADNWSVTVISKSASVWQEPRTGSKKLGSVEHGTKLPCVVWGNTYAPAVDGDFYAVRYKGRDGWVNKAYVVQAPLEIVLMESNVPALIAPDSRAKRVGSLSKLTRLRVIGAYDNYYIVNLRDAAAAFIPMDVRHYDSTFETMYDQCPTAPGRTGYKTALRTGPGNSYPVIKDLNAGTTFDCLDLVDGFYMIRYESKGTRGFGFISANDAQVQGF